MEKYLFFLLPNSGIIQDLSFVQASGNGATYVSASFVQVWVGSEYDGPDVSE